MATITSSILSKTFSVKGAISPSCYAEHDYLGIPGQEIVGQFTSDAKVDFYIMNNQQVNQLQTSNCGDIHPALLTVKGVTSYTIHFVVPLNELYYLIFSNPTNSNPINVNLYVGILDRSQSTAYITVQTITTVISQIVTSMEIPSAFLDNPWVLAFAGIAVIVVLFLALRTTTTQKRRRR